MTRTELLAPARDLACARAAIDCGADAVYLGAPRFGARRAAGNFINDIAAAVGHAHRYWARVYITLNTLLHDNELPDAVRLAWLLYETGVDALIIQDTGLIECDLPPLPLIASTQMHNHTPERVAFLERTGFQRAILARELTLDEIRDVRQAAPSIELECFIHGALCVCYSGQCCLSYTLGGRSGNRGDCAQPCRRAYRLVDASGQEIGEERHWLSIRDLNLSEYMGDLLDAGVTSFKIEGRLKDRAYVANVVAHYRRALDDLLRERGLQRSSSGASSPGFTPDPAKSFNRGFTTYFLHGRSGKIGSPETPKMIGEPVGRVKRLGETVGRVVHRGPESFELDGQVELHAGDGLCFFDSHGRLLGTNINAVSGRTVTPDKMAGIQADTVIYRNHDHVFMSQVTRSRPERKIAVTETLRPSGLEALDEDGNRAEVPFVNAPAPAGNRDRALETIRRQLAKTGDTEFACGRIAVECDPVPFLPISVLNALRREALERLTAERERNRPRRTGKIVPNDVPYPERTLSYLGNVLNRKAEQFYRRHGVESIEWAAESGLDMCGRQVMTTRYCLKYELGCCPHEGDAEDFNEPLFLIDDEGRRLELRFDCARCVMEIYAT